MPGACAIGLAVRTQLLALAFAGIVMRQGMSINTRGLAPLRGVLAALIRPRHGKPSERRPTIFLISLRASVVSGSKRAL